MSYDRHRRKIVKFGGTNGSALDDTWLWSGRFEQSVSVHSPPGRWGAGLVFHAAHGSSMLVGGENGSQIFNDVWEWDGGGWAPVSLGNGPARRAYPGMAYDRLPGRCGAGGGMDPGRGYNDRTYELTADRPRSSVDHTGCRSELQVTCAAGWHWPCQCVHLEGLSVPSVTDSQTPVLLASSPANAAFGVGTSKEPATRKPSAQVHWQS